LKKKSLNYQTKNRKDQKFTKNNKKLVAGAYSQSTGIDLIRHHVADFITRRDGAGIPATDFNNVCLFGGASEAIRVYFLRKMFKK
jgi:aspartate/methionine/tyrosine aminotransferase